MPAQTKEPNSDMEGRNSLNRYGATPFFLAAEVRATCR